MVGFFCCSTRTPTRVEGAESFSRATEAGANTGTANNNVKHPRFSVTLMSADRYGCIKGLQVQGQHYLDYPSSGSSHFGADFAPHDDPRFTSGINRGSLAAVATNHKMAVLLTQILQHISTALAQSLKKYNVCFVFCFLVACDV